MTFPNARDCEHGHQRGKCPECDAAADIADLTASLVAAESEARALRCEVERLRGLLRAVVDELDQDQAPGHCHAVHGVWDRDNGIFAGKPCKWCETWAEVRAEVMGSNVEVTGTP